MNFSGVDHMLDEYLRRNSMKLLGVAVASDVTDCRRKQYFLAIVIGNPNSSMLPCLNRVCPNGCEVEAPIDMFARVMQIYGV